MTSTDQSVALQASPPLPALVRPVAHPGVVVPFLLRLCTRIFTLSLVANALVALWIYFLVPRNMEDPDIWWHLRNADLQWHARAWLHQDLYSYTAVGAPWINHEWLAEVPFYLGWRVAGTTGLYLVTLLTIEFIFLGVFRLTCNAAARQGAKGHAIPTLATVIASVLATVSFGPRMLLFGWACLVIELLLLQRFVNDRSAANNSLFALPVLFVAWINLHGSWLIGMVLFAAFVVCGSISLKTGSIVNPRWTPFQARKLLLVLLLSLGALFLNPYGWHLVAYPFDLAFHQKLNVASAAEWKPLDFQSARGLIFLVVVGTLFLAQLRKRFRWTLGELAFAAIGIYASLRHSRFLFLGALLVMPLVGRQLSRLMAQRDPSAEESKKQSSERFKPRPGLHAGLHAGLLAAILGMATLATVKGTRTYGHQQEKFPVAALPFLVGFHPHGRLFNEYLWGGYLAYNVPGIPVFIDSRMDIFERNGTLRDYLDIIYIRNSLALLDRHRVRYVLFEKDTPLVYLLEQTHTWKHDYDDGNVILLERSQIPDTWAKSLPPRTIALPQAAP